MEGGRLSETRLQTNVAYLRPDTLQPLLKLLHRTLVFRRLTIASQRTLITLRAPSAATSVDTSNLLDVS